MNKVLTNCLLSVIIKPRKQNDCSREEDFNGMSRDRGEYLQCCHCGSIHKQQIQCNDDDLYIEAECMKCKDTVMHLRCGEQYEDIYMYYDSTLDGRFYNYNKTK